MTVWLREKNRWTRRPTLTHLNTHIYVCIPANLLTYTHLSDKNCLLLTPVLLPSSPFCLGGQQGKRGWDRRWCVFADDVFKYYRAEGDERPCVRGGWESREKRLIDVKTKCPASSFIFHIFLYFNPPWRGRASFRWQKCWACSSRRLSPHRLALTALSCTPLRASSTLALNLDRWHYSSTLLPWRWCSPGVCRLSLFLLPIQPSHSIFLSFSLSMYIYVCFIHIWWLMRTGYGNVA